RNFGTMFSLRIGKPTISIKGQNSIAQRNNHSHVSLIKISPDLVEIVGSKNIIIVEAVIPVNSTRSKVAFNQVYNARSSTVPLGPLVKLDPLVFESLLL